MKLSLIAAMSCNRVIGLNNTIPWRIKEDLKYFKEKTLYKPVIMGRKTFESIGRLLPDRLNIIVTKKLDYIVKDAIIVNSIEEAIGICILRIGSLESNDEIMVIGGQEIYEQTLPLAERVYLTIIDKEIEGDAFFPELDADEWEIIETSKAKGNPPFSFNVFERKV